MANAPCNHCGSTAGPDHPCPAKLLGKVLDNRYQIESVLGQGGMGMVFRATQTAVKRAVAVKTLHPSLAAAPQFFERFRREAEVASRLNHPNIITVFDFGRTEDGTCYFVMELVNGESLKQLVKREGPMSLRRAVAIVEQAAKGLAHAHKENVVHRDIKPHNLLVSQVDGADFVKILDFGLVKALEIEEEEQLTSTGQVLGTPQYMSPEQAGGENVDSRSDLYSLGGVLYFCLTGGSPFGANTVRKALTAAITQQVPAVATKRHGAPVPRALDEFFRQALAGDREKRYQSAEELVHAMHEAIAGCSDAELDARPAHTEGDAGAGSDPKRGRTPASSPSKSKSKSGASKSGLQKAATPSSRPSNVVVDHGALGHSKPRATAGEIPSARAPAALPEPASRPMPWGIVAVAALLLFAVGGGVVVGLRRSEDKAPVNPPAVTTRPVETVTPPPDKPVQPPQPAADVKVKVHSTPDGAEVFVGDERRGVTPLQLSLARGKSHELLLRHDGFSPTSHEVDLSTYDGAVKNEDVTLQPLPRNTTRPPPHNPPKKKGDDIPVFE